MRTERPRLNERLATDSYLENGLLVHGGARCWQCWFLSLVSMEKAQVEESVSNDLFRNGARRHGKGILNILIGFIGRFVK